ncbi:50S ribosomal protein L21 [candidate division WWE3 bacterium]|nr:50S ribosomal protein L21 [candidate division WWE3 bacterium]
MKYAIVQLGGRQYKVVEGQSVKVDPQKDIKFDVLAAYDGKSFSVGAPYLGNVQISASVSGGVLKKTRIARFRAKSRYRKVTGHKQPFVCLKVDSINFDAEKPAGRRKKA